ncbi:MAG: trypsin-like peptidase domain-containing protein [Clostridia bacterium]|nr:trypsin-like peptidase domain-containing protein [Clostridia bacterium]
MENFEKNENVISDANIDSDTISYNSKGENLGTENTAAGTNQGSYFQQNAAFANNSYSSGSNDRNDSYKTPSFYTERYKKTNGKKGISLLQLILASLMSAILGGALVGVVLVFVPSAVQPTVKSYFGNFIPGKQTAAQNNSSVLKKVEIEKTDSPVSAIAEKVSPSIVGIRVESGRVQDFFGFGAQQPASEGSGIIIKSDGYIMTNNHVVAGAIDSSTGTLNKGAKIEVILPNQINKPYIAQVVGRDAKTDLAVLKINATGLPAAELGNSDELKVGELAVAIGNPGGLEFMGSVTVGVISGVNRTISAEDNSELKLIQTDASINPGNSGGALVNSKGQIVGVNSSKIVAQGFEGLGFAIPINKAKEITDSLIEFKYVKGRPLLGVTIDQEFTEEMAKQYNVPFGLLVSGVTPFSGANKAGVQKNDIIVKFDGKKITTFNELENLKNKHKPGEEVEMEVYRYSDEKYHKLKIVLGENKN